MSWFQSTNLASFAKTALKEAQKTIDKALDINESESDGSLSSSTTSEKVAAVTEAATDFFASWGVVGAKKSKELGNESNNSPSKVSEDYSAKNAAEGKGKRKLEHKRSSSLESAQIVNQVKKESLTNDIPVTLLPLPPSILDTGEITSKTGPSQHHQRSFSDTIFNLTNDSHEFVQVLDEPEIFPDKAPNIINTIACISSNINPELNLVSEEEIQTPNIIDSSEDVKVLEPEIINEEQFSRCDLTKEDHILETVDLNEESWNHVQNTNHDTLTLSDNIGFDSSSWSWANDESTIKSKEEECGENITLEEDSTPISLNHEEQESFKPSPISLQENILINLGQSEEDNEPILDDFITDQQQKDTEESQLESSSGTMVLDQSYKTEEIVENSLEHDDKMFKASSPDSPRSSSPLQISTNYEDNQSPENHFEIMSNSLKIECHSIPESFLPESSRSSSIVVVSTRASSGGSAASNGSDMQRDMDLESSHQDHHHESEGSGSSAGYERVELPSSTHSSDPTSPEFVNKSKHRKGPSSASSSDIEVILSSEFTRHCQIPSETSENIVIKPIMTSIYQQTSSEIQDSETQTDLVDERKALAEEIPKKVTHEISTIIAEKDQMIEQLTDEGEKLSKKQFDLSQVIKKLRGKEKELENTVKNLKGELAGKNLENDRLTKSFINKESSEKNLNDNVQKLTTEKRALELKIEQLQSELEDANENCSTMKASVEDASVEILELKNAISSAQRDSTELDNLTREKSDLISRNESLQKELDNLRQTINLHQDKSASRESELQTQVSTLTRKVHHLENQVADVSSEVADATMPLSLEIEKLQGELKQSQILYEKRESSLNIQILDLEMKCKNSSEKENFLKEQTTALQTSIASLEVRLKDSDTENRNLKRDSSFREENEQKRIQEKMLKISKMETLNKKLTGEVERLNQENEQLGMELKSEKIFIEQEKKRSQALLDQLSSTGRNVNHHQLTKSNSISNPTNANFSKSGENSPSSNSVVSESSYLDEVLDPQLGNHRSMTPRSFFDSYSSTGLMEHLQSQLRQREIEVFQFHEEISKNEKIRKSLNEEIAKLTMRNHEFQQETERLSELQPKLEELEKNYNALLQMYGEKVEETDELRMDLQDVKDMYKTQIEQLLKR